MKLLQNVKPLIRSGIFGAVLAPSIYILIDAIIGVLCGDYFFPASIPLFVQLIILGFLSGLLMYYFKERKNEFFRRTTAKTILLFVLLIPAFFFPVSYVCDLFGHACLTIHGVPLPTTIFGEVMYADTAAISIFLLIELVGFVIDFLFYYLISATLVFLSKFIWFGIKRLFEKSEN